MKKIVYVVGIIIVILLFPLASAADSTKKNSQLAAPRTGTATFNATYGRDPGRDEVMLTIDDLDYSSVLDSVASLGISILTVDCQYGQPKPGGTPIEITMQQDAHANFINIADLTGGTYYVYTNPSWDSAVATEISNRVGTGKGDVVFTFDISASLFWDTSLVPDLKTKTKGIVDALATLDIAFGLGTHVDYPHYYSSAGYFADYGLSATGDYAWHRNLDITPGGATVKGRIDSDIIAGYDGADIPQDYSRVVYETQFFSWRSDAERIVVVYGDAPAHSAPLSGNVGGISVPIDKVGLLAPYIGLASTIIAATAAATVYVKHAKRRKEKK